MIRFVFVSCWRGRKYDVRVKKVSWRGHRVGAFSVPEQPHMAKPFLRLPEMMVGCGKGGVGLKGWEGEWSISSSSWHTDRMAATAAKQSETDRQKSLIRNTRSFRKTALSVMDAWHWPLILGRCIYQGCRTIVFVCKLFSSLGKMLLCSHSFTLPLLQDNNNRFQFSLLSALLDVSGKALNFGWSYFEHCHFYQCKSDRL